MAAFYVYKLFEKLNYTKAKRFAWKLCKNWNHLTKLKRRSSKRTSGYLTSKRPNLRLSEPESYVQKEICDFPQDTIISATQGWYSTATTGSVEL